MSEHPLQGRSSVPSSDSELEAFTHNAPARHARTEHPGPPRSQGRSAESSDDSPAGSAPPSASGEANSDSPDGAARPKRRRRGGRGRRGRGTADAGSEDAREGAAEAGASESPDDGGSDEGVKKKSRRRGGRGRRGKKTTTSAAGESEEAGEPQSDDANGGEDAPTGERRTKRLRSRRSRSARDKTSDDGSAASEGDTQDDATSDSSAKTSRKRGSRGGRGRKRKPAAVGAEFLPGEDDDLPELSELPDSAVLVSESKQGGTRKTKAKSRKKAARSSSKSKAKKEDSEEPEPPKKRDILVNAGDPEETRIAVVEDGKIAELQMTVKKHVSFVSDIYRGRVVNIESAIGAAFIDFGQGRNGFLHASDILPTYGDPDWSLEKLLSTPVEADEADDGDDVDDAESDDADDADDDAEAEAAKKASAKKAPARGRGKGAHKGRPQRVRIPIDKLVKKGQMVAVQITKDAIGDKGPTLTTYVSIPGRYLVLMPSLERTGVSRKIDDDKERRRLKRILNAMEIPEGMGVIVRTAGVGKTKAELQRDLDYLLLAWEDFARRLRSGRNPAPLYQESDVSIRTMRDLFTSETESVIVDDDEVFDRIVEFTKKLMPEYVDRVKHHEGTRPLFQMHGVEQDFEKIFSRRVELPSGGSIVIDQTEALVAIDVNSGRTREAGAEFEDIALKTNLEAAPEIARQILLRDLGGIIVLDYIDMARANSRRAVEKATRDCLKRDRARSKIGRISQFGLLELTRQRLGPGLNKLVYDTCATCRGSGRRRKASSRAQAILRRLGASLALKGFSNVEVRANPDVIEYLQNELVTQIKKLEEASGRGLQLMPVPDQVEDSVLHYLRADGREVRPGGRRKR